MDNVNGNGNGYGNSLSNNNNDGLDKKGNITLIDPNNVVGFLNKHAQESQIISSLAGELIKSNGELIINNKKLVESHLTEKNELLRKLRKQEKIIKQLDDKIEIKNKELELNKNAREGLMSASLELTEEQKVEINKLKNSIIEKDKKISEIVEVLHNNEKILETVNEESSLYKCQVEKILQNLTLKIEKLEEELTQKDINHKRELEEKTNDYEDKQKKLKTQLIENFKNNFSNLFEKK